MSISSLEIITEIAQSLVVILIIEMNDHINITFHDTKCSI